MPTIATNNEVITVIIIFTVEPDRQQELIDAIADFIETVKQQPGFVSASLHKSIDGVKVANYAQWRTLEDYQSFRNNAEVRAKAAKLGEFNPPDVHIYEVVISRSKVGTPQIQKGGYLSHFAEFSMTPENQPTMVQLAQQYVDEAMQQPGLLSANFHRSLDETRVINYGQWRDRQAIEELKQQPGFSSQSPYWAGIAENEHHLYEVVFTEPQQ